MRNKNACTPARAVVVATVLSAAAAAPASVAAQGERRSEPGGAQSDSVAEIMVTATRIVRDGYEAPTPTTVLGAEAIQAAAPQNLADFVNRLPQLANSTTPRTGGPGIGGGTGGANFLNLRGLGANRTLTLLDGRRVVAAATIGAVDVNLLPTALISRIDVVTGGASAAYGSDAVSGVVNFVLDKKFAGLKANLAAGASTEGDGEQVNAELAFGAPFGSGRGHVLVSGQYAKMHAIQEAGSRDWYGGWKIIGNPAFTPSSGQPGSFLLPQIGLARATDGGVIVAGPLRGIQFGPGGVLQPFTFGTLQNGLIMSGGTPNDVGSRFQLMPPLEQGSAFVRSSYDLDESTTVYFEGSYGRSEVTTHSSPYVRHGNILVSSENPYIPAALPMAGIGSFPLGRTNFDLGIPEGHNVRELFRGVGGVDGRFLTTGTWQAYYQYGKSKILNEVLQDPIVANFNRAVDVVRNPATGGVAGVAAGAPVCRSTIVNPADGCQPLNVFGYGAPSVEAIRYVNGAASQNIELRQDVVAISGQLEPFAAWAGPVSLAGGAEYRREKYAATADALSVSTSYWLGNYKPGGGDYHVTEAFLEAVLPLLNGRPLVRSLDLNGAARFTDYSTSGSVTTWKGGITYDVNEQLRLRVTRSRDIRAPNMDEMFLGGQANSIGVRDVLAPGAPSVFITQITSGNPALTPESADTKSFGVVYRPSWLQGLTASIDYYDISIDDAIVMRFAPTVINECYGFGVPSVPSSCSAITLATPGTIAGAIVRVGGVNVQSIATSGYDLELSYATDLSAIVSGWPGHLGIRALGTNVRKNERMLDGATTNNLGVITEGSIKWRGLLSAEYELGRSTTGLSARYIGPSVYNNFALGSAQSVDVNRISSAIYLDVSQSVRMHVGNAEAEVYAVIENALDRDPPIVGSSLGNNYSDYGTYPAVFDTIGRVVRVGVRVRY